MDSSMFAKTDKFFGLECATIADIRSLFVWADKRAFKTDVTCLNVSKSCRRVLSDRGFVEVLSHVSRKSKPYFRVILRRNFNWFMTIMSKKHVEDIIEIGIRGIEIDSIEYFIHCFLKKEFLRKMKNNFTLTEIR